MTRLITGLVTGLIITVCVHPGPATAADIAVIDRDASGFALTPEAARQLDIKVRLVPAGSAPAERPTLPRSRDYAK